MARLGKKNRGHRREIAGKKDTNTGSQVLRKWLFDRKLS